MFGTNITIDVAKHAISSPEKIALVDRNLKQLNYFELDEQIWMTANFLRLRGIIPGEVVGIYCQKEINSILLCLGIARYGATVITLPKTASDSQIRDLCSFANVSHIFTDSEFTIKIDLPIHRFSINSLISIDSQKNNLIQENPEAPWLIISGSGSTGKPKLIPVKHSTQQIRNDMSKEWLDLKGEDVVASLSHFDFTHPKNRLLETFHAGSTYISDMSPIPISQLCIKHQITVLHASVFHIQKELNNMGSERFQPLHTLRMLCMSASNINQALREKIRERLTENLYVRYATNETGTISVAKPPKVFEKEGSVGICLNKVKVRLKDNLTSTRDSKLTGAIVIDSPGNVEGYLNEPETTRMRFTKQGFTPNDLVKIDKDGEIIFLGRADEMMIFNGINVYPQEIESCLSKNLKIEDVVCLKLFNHVNQDIPVAAVQIRSDSQSSEIELLEYCRSLLGIYSPKRIFILDKIPRNDRGKVNREEIKLAINKIRSSDNLP